ncbi:DUF2280 domain-containing protein [Salinibacter altiplanensis]|uniref:DUF2280 domain-containing protein n=1 Tax=Salinibacter altiplanensis TaxID=1803181 RepID=UPI000C9ED55E|nr:DUF2280 domain-containing protein [Salinibacter altiplanensis]
MATLKSRHKRLIVKRLAVFDRPSDVQDEVRERFGLEVDSPQLAHYDPTTRKGQGLAQGLTALFHKTRERFLDEYTETAIQHKAVRLRRLERIANKFSQMRNYVAEMDALEQAAKEMGGAYTNRHTLDASVSNPEDVDFDDLTDEQIEQIAAGEPLREVLASDQVDT